MNPSKVVSEDVGTPVACQSLQTTKPIDDAPVALKLVVVTLAVLEALPSDDPPPGVTVAAPVTTYNFIDWSLLNAYVPVTVIPVRPADRTA